MSVILAVDDEIVSRLMLRTQLERLGHEVIEAVDVEDAVTRFTSTTVDTVIADFEMPGGSGLDLFERLRALDAESHVPFVLLTGTANEADLGDERAASVDAYLTKPVGTAALDEVVSRLLAPTG